MTHPRVARSSLRKPAALGVRVIAQARAGAAREALARLNADPETLHDLRVSLRRLRSWLQTFRPHVGDTVRRRTFRRLRRLVHATNRARDVEVWQVWLAEQGELPRNARAGERWVAAWLDGEGAKEHERSLGRLARKLPKVLAMLDDELSAYTLRVRRDADDDRMSSALADALRQEWRRLERRLARVETLADADAIHAARIAAKTLRYVVETLETRDAESVAESLSRLQDVLGAVHDMQSFVDHLVDAVEAAGAADARRRARRALGLEPEEDSAPPRGAVAGLGELARRAQSRAEREFRRFTEEWDRARAAEVEAAIERLAAGLADDAIHADEGPGMPGPSRGV